MTLCSAIGAVVGWESSDFQTPLSGHRSPVRAFVPMGAFAMSISRKYSQDSCGDTYDGDATCFQESIRKIYEKYNCS
jgi:hypothetical protein